MIEFNALEPSTWPLVLTAEQVAAIYQRPILGLKKACQLHRFLPAPYKTHPYRWRKVAVLRDVEGTAPLRKASGF